MRLEDLVILSMEIPPRGISIPLGLVSFGCGIANGYCYAKGINISDGGSSALMFGPPFLKGTAVGLYNLFAIDPLRKPEEMGMSLSFGPLAYAAGLLENTVGFGLGFLAGKIH